MSIHIMSTVGIKLRELREKSGLSLRRAAVQADVDIAILSKMERGERKFSKELIIRLSELYNTKPDLLIIDFLSEKVLYDLKDEEFGLKALKLAEQKIRYNELK